MKYWSVRMLKLTCGFGKNLYILSLVFYCWIFGLQVLLFFEFFALLLCLPCFRILRENFFSLFLLFLLIISTSMAGAGCKPITELPIKVVRDRWVEKKESEPVVSAFNECTTNEIEIRGWWGFRVSYEVSKGCYPLNGNFEPWYGGGRSGFYLQQYLLRVGSIFLFIPLSTIYSTYPVWHPCSWQGVLEGDY